MTVWQEETTPGHTEHFFTYTPVKVPEYYDESRIDTLEKMRANMLFRTRKNCTQVTCVIFFLPESDSNIEKGTE